MNFADFHFLRPLFLLGIPPLLFLVWMLSRQTLSSNWARYFNAAQLKVLTIGQTRGYTLLISGLALAWILACIALAGPTWEQRPTPASANHQPLVILFDQSPSMMASDLTPNRVTRARLKLIDLLRGRRDGETALIAYADTPHLVAPLTEDARTIEALLPALTPGIMPVPGSNTEAAFQMARELIENAGYLSGEILLVTDGVAPEAQREIQSRGPDNIRLSILGVGSVEGAPIPAGGGFVRDFRGQIVIAGLNRDELRSLAASMNGRYTDLLPDDADINYLLEGFTTPRIDDGQDTPSSYDQWYDMGYWICLLLLPFALFAWRRDLVFGLVIALPVLTYTPHSEALDWQDLWRTPDQQGQQALKEQDYATAANNFERLDWRGYAQYRAGDYGAAAESLKVGESSDDLYNLGNALARSGQLEASLEAYEKALGLDPDMEDAQFNRQLVEQLLEQQQQNQQENQQDQGGEQGQQQNQEGDNSQREDSGDGSEIESDQQTGDQGSSSASAESDVPPSDQQSAANSQNQSEAYAAEQEAEQQAAAMADQMEQEGENAEEEEQQLLAQPSDQPLSQSSEQWLRAIPDDPSGLLRRKFQYQSDLYRSLQRYGPPMPPNLTEERY